MTRATLPTPEVLPPDASPAAGLLPLSVAQAEVWRACKLSSDPALYNIGGYAGITGPLDRAVFRAALLDAIGDADGLLYRFVETADGPRQVRVPATQIDLPSIDCSGHADPVRDALEWMRAELKKPFDLSGGPLFRFALIQVADDRAFCFTGFHHLVADLFSAALLAQRTADIYNARLQGTPVPQSALTAWSDVLEDEAQYAASIRCGRDRDYWLQQLRDRPDPATLSGRPPAWLAGAVTSTLLVPEPTVARLAATGEAGAAGLPAVLHAAVALYLSRRTGRHDLIVGMPVSGRTHATLRRAVGFVSNVVPLRLNVDSAQDFIGLARQTGIRMREALRHQRYWRSALRGDLGLVANDPNPYGTVLNFMPGDVEFDFGGSAANFNAFTHVPWIEDLSITVHVRGGGSAIEVQFDGNDAHYDQRLLERHQQAFMGLLEAIASRPEAPVGQLPLPGMDRVEQQAKRRDRSLPREAIEPPRTPTEMRLAAIWAAVLRLARIGRNEDFFAAGGQSLLALQVVARVRDSFHLELPLKALFDAPTIEELAAAIDRALRSGGTRPLDPILPQPRSRPAPLSWSQERMWLIQSMNPGNTAYNMAGALWLRGRLDVDALSQCIDVLFERHEILRSRVCVVDEQLAQVIEPWSAGLLQVVDLRSRQDAEAQAMQQLEASVRGVFDLARGRLIRAHLLQAADEVFLLGFVLHHIVGDQWSIGVFGRELAALYNARRRGQVVPLEPLPVTYRDYAYWQRGSSFEAESDRQLAYWKRQLAHVPAVELPLDFPRPKVWTMNGAIDQRQLPAGLLDALDALGRDSGSTLFMVLLAAFAALLHRISGQQDIAVAVPVANRTHSELEGLVGTFVNTVVLRIGVDGDSQFDALLARVRAVALDAFAHQDVSFDRLVRELGQRADPSRAPLAQVMFNVGNVPMHDIELEGVSRDIVQLDRGGAQFELSFTVDTEITRLLTVEYNTDLFERSGIERLTGQYCALLESIVQAPRAATGKLRLLPAEQLAMLRGWNATAMAWPAGTTFPRLFAAQVRQSPDAVAVSFAGEALTYARLDAHACRLARDLRAAGVGRGTRVAVCMPRSLPMLVGLLGVQQAGGAYVPLDPGFPVERLQYMLADSVAAVLLTAGPLPDGFAVPEGIRVLDVAVTSSDAPLPAVAGDAGEEPAPEDAAYVLYTSGSTGRPKGVIISHGALANFLLSMRARPGLVATDVLAAVTTISFDIAGLELYLPLIVGARIELVSREVAADGGALARLLQVANVTVLQATPATWRMLVEAGWQGGPQYRALCGGEALSRQLADDVLDRVGALWNMYGPTETTIWSTVERVQPGTGAISIGLPIANTQVWILDAGGERVPAGVTGEICIGGAGVAIGYHGRPDLTAERFTPDGQAGGPGARLYRTGDLGRWGADGRLYHLGRSDHQVKLRGFRIEPGEIEQVLGAHAAVQHAVVVLREAQAEDPRLVAYVVFREGADATVSELRSHLRARLPDYMVPSLIVMLESMPLTPNGKIDRAALPDPFVGQHGAAAAAAPMQLTATEQVLVEIWKSVLHVDAVGVDDNFFELGGYSLLSLRVAKLVARRTGARLDPRALFFQNLREIAVSLDAQVSVAAAGTS